MADYTLAEIRTMQEDAIRRVRDMHERAKLSLESSNNTYFGSHDQTSPSKPPVTNNRPVRNGTPPKPPHKQGYGRLASSHNEVKNIEKQAPKHKTEHVPIHNSSHFHEPPKHESATGSFLGSGIFKSFDIKGIMKSFNIKEILNNPEQAFVLMILVLLLSEGADEMLILALIYIML